KNFSAVEGVISKRPHLIERTCERDDSRARNPSISWLQPRHSTKCSGQANASPCVGSKRSHANFRSDSGCRSSATSACRSKKAHWIFYGAERSIFVAASH